MNTELALTILQQFLDRGGVALCICAGSRNAPLVSLAVAHSCLQTYYFYEERSAAFFALGLSQRTSRPVAVMTTSGTAAAELLPAMMEAYYSETPLVAITADRPREYRGTNAPQSCEQVGLYGQYAKWEADVAGKEHFDLLDWDLTGPAHINVCFEEPLHCIYLGNELIPSLDEVSIPPVRKTELTQLTRFLEKARYPFVIVGALDMVEREGVKHFLMRLQAPVYFEGLSGLREDPDVQHLRIIQSNRQWEVSTAAGYAIDAVLRIGGIPTVRTWRDLEELEDKVNVCSLSRLPFSGLSWGNVISSTSLGGDLQAYLWPSISFGSAQRWLNHDRSYQCRLLQLFKEEPLAEASLVYEWASQLSNQAVVYLGNSTPIRTWDLVAPSEDKQLSVYATRGLSGIDGQLSTFLGLCLPNSINWALLGDLTTLYDMAGLWIAQQLPHTAFNLLVINNGGGQIFSNMYREKEFLNAHALQFKGLADLWKIEYARWETIPVHLPSTGQRLIELVPDEQASQRFWQKLQDISLYVER